jgi:hypothetical protein
MLTDVSNTHTRLFIVVANGDRAGAAAIMERCRSHHVCYELVRTTVSLSEPLLRTARRRAAERGVTLSEFVEDAVRFQLARKPSSAAAPFRLHTVKGKLVQPELDLDRTSTLEILDNELKFAGSR